MTIVHALLRRPRGVIVALLLGLAFLSGGPRAEGRGDMLQIALPLVAWGCAGLSGRGAEVFVRYWVHFVILHGTKQGLGDHPVNIRPGGGGEGMPSGHTSTAVFGASSLVHDCLRNHPAAQALTILSAGYVGASRIDAGKHDIWQVMAGALLGYGCDRALRRRSRGRAALVLAARAVRRTAARAARVFLRSMRLST